MSQIREYGGTENHKRYRYAKKLWEGDDAHTTTLLVMAMDLFGPDDLSWMQWAPETLKIEIFEGYSAKPSKLALDRLMAGIAILTTDSFWNSLPKFIDICNAMAGEGVDDTFNIADTTEITWSVVESVLLTQEEPQFSEEIVAYIEEQIKSEGLGQVPKALRSIVPTFVNDPASGFADDPILYGAIFDNAHDEVREIDETIGEELHELARELEQIPLRHGKNMDIAQAMKQSLKL